MRFPLQLMTILAFAMTGCAPLREKTINDYEAVYESPSATSTSARLAHSLALKSLELGDLDSAEKHAKKALGIDPDFGPAHNTLGTIYFAQHKYYPAAWEFEYAKRLLPNHPHPLNNLGLVYEAALRWDDAIVFYQQANLIEPTNSEYLGNLTRAQIRNGEHPAALLGQLYSLVEIENRPQWAEWARRQIAIGKQRNPWESLSVDQHCSEIIFSDSQYDSNGQDSYLHDLPPPSFPDSKSKESTIIEPIEIENIEPNMSTDGLLQ